MRVSLREVWPAVRARVWGCAAALVAALVVGGGVAAFVAWPTVHLGTPGDALASVVAPRFAGTVTGAELRTADGTKVPVRLQDGKVVPLVKVGSGERVSVRLAVKRPGWAAWLVGHTDHRTFTVETPTAHLLGRWLQVKAGGPVTVAFDTPVAQVSFANHTPRTLRAAAGYRARRASSPPGRTPPARSTWPRPRAAGSACRRPWRSSGSRRGRTRSCSPIRRPGSRSAPSASSR